METWSVQYAMYGHRAKLRGNEAAGKNSDDALLVINKPQTAKSFVKKSLVDFTIGASVFSSSRP